MFLCALALSGCGGSGPGEPVGPAFELDRLPARPGCELVRLGFRVITFNLGAGEPVTASLDGGPPLPTAWDVGFRPDPFGALLIRDRSGQVVVRDGESEPQPDRDFVRLAGHPVCVSPTVVWVFYAGTF